jgi:hypothetical protein
MKTKRVKAQLILGALADRDLERQYVIPADAESYERMVEQMAVVLYESQMVPCRWARIPYSEQVPWIQLSKDALRAIGITAPKQPANHIGGSNEMVQPTATTPVNR